MHADALRFFQSLLDRAGALTFKVRGVRLICVHASSFNQHWLL